MQGMDDERRILGCMVEGQGQFGTLCIKHCGHETDSSLTPINASCGMIRRGTLFVLVKGQVLDSACETLWAR